MQLLLIIPRIKKIYNETMDNRMISKLNDKNKLIEGFNLLRKFDIEENFVLKPNTRQNERRLVFSLIIFLYYFFSLQ